MKTYLLTLMLVLTGCLACQPTASAQTKHNESISKEQFRKKQRDFIIREARLSPKEASYFFPLFFELQDKKKLLTDDADAKRKRHWRKSWTRSNTSRLSTRFSMPT